MPEPTERPSTSPRIDRPEIAADPRVSVHLGGLGDVVILEGDAEILTGADDDLAERLAAASNEKFPSTG